MSALRTAFLAVLSEAQKKRAGCDPQVWILHERRTMHNLVNDERAARCLPPVTIADVERVENQAAGHCDYSQKFALYCAEMAQGKGFRP